MSIHDIAGPVVFLVAIAACGGEGSEGLGTTGDVGGSTTGSVSLASSFMNVSANMTAAVLARTTKRAKLLILGNILPIEDNPVRMAEQLAMADLISGGRVLSGFVRGVGVDSRSVPSGLIPNCLEDSPLGWLGANSLRFSTSSACISASTRV